MKARTWTVLLAALTIVSVAAVVQVTYAQPGGPGGGPGGGGGRGGGGFDPGQMQSRMLENVKTALGVSDAEWEAIEPLAQKVQEARMATRIVGGRGMRGSGGGPGGAPGGGPQGEGAPPAMPGGGPREMTEVAALRTVVANADATDSEIESKLTALRAAMATARKKLETAQTNLCGVLDVRQEAKLVLMGFLD